MASNADYRRMARAVNRYVTWDLSRRRTFTPAEKSLISRAFDELQRVRAAGLTPHRIRRRPGESDRSYRRRLAGLKTQAGTQGSALAAVPVRVSSTETVSIVKGRRVQVRSRLTGRRQWFLAFDPRGLSVDSAREVARVWRAVVGQGAERVRLALGSRRTGDFSTFTDEEDLLGAVDAALELYGDRAGFVLVGVYAMSGGKRKTRKAGPTSQSLRRRVQDAFETGRKVGGWVTLEDIRASMPDVSRARLERELLRLYDRQVINLSTEDNTKAITAGMEEAGMKLGIDKVHWLRFRGS